MSKLSPDLCVKCKGVRLACRKPLCPILARYKFSRLVSSKLLADKLLGATPPEVLVGSRSWPKVTLGPLIPPVSGLEAELYSKPELLYGKSIKEVIALRSQLVRSVFTLNVKDACKSNRLLELTRGLAISSQPVDMEVKFSKPPRPTLRFDGVLAPTGPAGVIEDLRVTGNSVVPSRVEKLLTDYDVKTVTAVRELYDAGMPTYYTSRLLSVGVLGRPASRLLVPSRWAITATDAMISSHLLGRIRSYEQLPGIQLFTQDYVGNHYEILLLPGSISYEFVEIWLPRSVWTVNSKEVFVESDHEDWRGKAGFSSLGGGYYAMKLPVYEYLQRVRRQAFIFAVREVTPDYWAPLGSWKIREAVRATLKTYPKKFSTVEEALKDVASRIITPSSEWLRKVKLLRSYTTQTTLKQF